MPGKKETPAKKTTPAEKKKAPKPAAGDGEKKEGGKRTHHKNRAETYSVYIYRVLKQVHPETGISKRSMSIMNSFINDVFEKISLEAAKLVRYNKKQTLSSREV